MYSHSPSDYPCPFCKLLHSPDEDSRTSNLTDIVYQNELVTALIGLRQWPENAGNVIVIPNEHYENIYDLPVEWGGRIHALVKAVALALKECLECAGVSIRQHNEPAGNQDVWHYHVHVTPRYPDDHFYTTYLTSAQVMAADDRAKLAARIRPAVEKFMVAG